MRDSLGELGERLDAAGEVVDPGVAAVEAKNGAGWGWARLGWRHFSVLE